MALKIKQTAVLMRLGNGMLQLQEVPAMNH